MAILTIVILVFIFNETPVTSIKVDNSKYSLDYLIKGGKVLGAKIVLDTKSLLISIEPSSEGELTVTIPRGLIDAKIDSDDDSFFVIVDGEEVKYEETKTKQYRTLTVPFVYGNVEIEIIGTSADSTKFISKQDFGNYNEIPCMVFGVATNGYETRIQYQKSTTQDTRLHLQELTYSQPE